jgi:hypothetical protein
MVLDVVRGIVQIVFTGLAPSSNHALGFPLTNLDQIFGQDSSFSRFGCQMCEFQSRAGAVFDRFRPHFVISSSSIVAWQLEASDLARLPAKRLNLERPTGIEPATSSLGIRITAPFIFTTYKTA